MKKSKIMLTILFVNATLMLNKEVYAEEIPDDLSGSTAVYQNKGGNGDELINKELRDLAFNFNYNLYLSSEIPFDKVFKNTNNWDNLTPDYLQNEPYARINNNMTIKDGDTLAAHNANLGNNTEVEQTMSTASFEYTQTDSVSTKNSHSAGVEVTTAAEMKFPLFSGSMSMKVKYDYNNTKEVVSSQVKKWTVPSQLIKVPAGRQYNINWVLNTGIATGTTDLTSRVNAAVPYSVTSVLPVGMTIKTYDQTVSGLPQNNKYIWGARDSWVVENDKTALKKWGESTYTAKYGTKLIMNIVDVTESKTRSKGSTSVPVVVKSIPMDVMPTIVE